ncbi:MAG: hypothetical protein BWY78_00339 [Alphaproteobacteria bacterium ADurb.Bin438]|nr:MAG: hypothetical protein BWY78_00339 [Alphaproteobacteria bacterium ADurb.Bin438]
MATDLIGLDDFGSYSKYPAKKNSSKKKETNKTLPAPIKYSDVKLGYTKDTAKTIISQTPYIPPKKGIENDPEYAKILSTLNNYTLVEFEISLHHKTKKEFSSHKRSQFIKFIGETCHDELMAKGFSEKEIKKMKEKGITPNGWSVHHKFPRAFKDEMGADYNNFKNLTLVNETQERGDDDVHRFMDKQVNEEIERLNKSEKAGLSNMTDLAKYLEKTGKKFKITIPWLNGNVYLTKEQEPIFAEIKKSKGEEYSNSVINKIKTTNNEASEILPSYKVRLKKQNLNLKNAHIKLPQLGNFNMARIKSQIAM